MSLFALALATAVQAAPVPRSPLPPVRWRNAEKPGFSRAPTVVGQRSAFECRARATQARNEAIAHGEPLNRMPAGILQHTVIRMVDGCPVSTRVVQSRPAR